MEDLETQNRQIAEHTRSIVSFRDSVLRTIGSYDGENMGKVAAQCLTLYNQTEPDRGTYTADPEREMLAEMVTKEYLDFVVGTTVHKDRLNWGDHLAYFYAGKMLTHKLFDAEGFPKITKARIHETIALKEWQKAAELIMDFGGISDSEAKIRAFKIHNGFLSERGYERLDGLPRDTVRFLFERIAQEGLVGGSYAAELCARCLEIISARLNNDIPVESAVLGKKIDATVYLILNGNGDRYEREQLFTNIESIQTIEQARQDFPELVPLANEVLEKIAAIPPGKSFRRELKREDELGGLFSWYEVRETCPQLQAFVASLSPLTEVCPKIKQYALDIIKDLWQEKVYYDVRHISSVIHHLYKRIGLETTLLLWRQWRNSSHPREWAKELVEEVKFDTFDDRYREDGKGPTYFDRRSWRWCPESFGKRDRLFYTIRRNSKAFVAFVLGRYRRLGDQEALQRANQYAEYIARAMLLGDHRPTFEQVKAKEVTEEAMDLRLHRIVAFHRFARKNPNLDLEEMALRGEITPDAIAAYPLWGMPEVLSLILTAREKGLDINTIITEVGRLAESMIPLSAIINRSGPVGKYPEDFIKEHQLAFASLIQQCRAAL